jgi:hypothetical protein
MAQLNDWQSAYSKLGEYITNNPTIRITPNLIAIPGEVRTEFYRLFDAVRVAFLREKFPDLLAEAELLSKNYGAVSQEVTESLEITDVKLVGGLNWFLSDPTNGLMRSLFDNLFNLVKGKIDTNAFEQLSLKSIRDSFNKLFKAGYEKWVIFSLLKAVAPDKLYAPDPADTSMQAQITDPETLPGLHEDEVPPQLETKSLSLGQSSGDVTFTVSDFIAHSTKMNRFFSLGSEIIDASWTAKSVSEKQEWIRLRTLTGLHIPIGGWPDMVIYAADKLDDLALVADFGRFCRPDVIIECVEQEGWYQQGGLERVKYYHDFLKPKLGTFVVSRVPVPEEAFKELELKPIADEAAIERPETSELPVLEEGTEILASKEKPAETVAGEALPAEEAVTEPLNIRILEVGYDQSLLAPIIEVFLTPKQEAEESPAQ